MNEITLLRQRIERYRRLHNLTYDPRARQVLRDLIAEAEKRIRELDENVDTAWQADPVAVTQRRTAKISNRNHANVLCF